MLLLMMMVVMTIELSRGCFVEVVVLIVVVGRDCELWSKWHHVGVVRSMDVANHLGMTRPWLGSNPGVVIVPTRDNESFC